MKTLLFEDFLLYILLSEFIEFWASFYNSMTKSGVNLPELILYTAPPKKTKQKVAVWILI